jgi:hypothetical protein
MKDREPVKSKSAGAVSLNADVYAVAAFVRCPHSRRRKLVP